MKWDDHDHTNAVFVYVVNSSFFDYRSKGNGLEKLNELVKKNKIKIVDTGIPKALSPTGKLSGAPGIGAYAKEGKVFLNPASSIVNGTFNPGTAVFGGISAADALATLIIHDLLHITKDLPSESLDNYRFLIARCPTKFIITFCCPRRLYSCS